MTAPDALEHPFGACLHMDFLIMKHGSEAAKVAKHALVMMDEKTKFVGTFPGNIRNNEFVLDAVHQFEGSDICIRRWWTDCAKEFAKYVYPSLGRFVRSVVCKMAHKEYQFPQRPRPTATGTCP